jgi:hypothetical protein
MNNDKKFFVITFTDENPQPPPPNGQAPTKPIINVPAYVEDWETAIERARAYAKDFKNTPEGRQAQNARLEIQSIVIGGTLLT